MIMMSQLETMLGQSVRNDGTMKVEKINQMRELNRLLSGGQLLEYHSGPSRVQELDIDSKPIQLRTQYLIVPGKEPEVWRVDPNWAGQVFLRRIQDEEILAQIKDYAQRLWEVADKLY